jgi:hypothetical protein
MIRNALTGEPKAEPKTLAEQKDDFTAEGAPPPGRKTVPEVAAPESKAPAPTAPKPTR